MAERAAFEVLTDAQLAEEKEALRECARTAVRRQQWGSATGSVSWGAPRKARARTEERLDLGDIHARRREANVQAARRVRRAESARRRAKPLNEYVTLFDENNVYKWGDARGSVHWRRPQSAGVPSSRGRALPSDAQKRATMLARLKGRETAYLRRRSQPPSRAPWGSGPPPSPPRTALHWADVEDVDAGLLLNSRRRGAAASHVQKVRLAESRRVEAGERGGDHQVWWGEAPAVPRARRTAFHGHGPRPDPHAVLARTLLSMGAEVARRRRRTRCRHCGLEAPASALFDGVALARHEARCFRSRGSGYFA